MIWNMRRRKKKVSLKWYFNSQPSIRESHTYNANFTSNERPFIALNTNTASWQGGLAYIYHVYGSDKGETVYSIQAKSWKAEAYRTVEFDEAPTGDLLAFLQANATPL